MGLEFCELCNEVLLSHLKSKPARVSSTLLALIVELWLATSSLRRNGKANAERIPIGKTFAVRKLK
jgi:hypothetical protein